MASLSGNRIVRHYLMLVAVIPLACITLAEYVPFFSTDIAKLLLFGIQATAPAIAAVIAVAYNKSLFGLKIFLKDKYASHFNIKLCSLAFVVPMALLLLAKLIVSLCDESGWTLGILSPQRILIIFWALIAEELGWRGFLQEQIERRFGMMLTPLIVGAIWGIWHFHYCLIGNMEPPFLLLLLGCIFESHGYYVITKLARGNILPASIWHFSGNLFINLFVLNAEGADGGILSYVFTTIVYGICVIAFFIYLRSQKKRTNV